MSTQELATFLLLLIFAVIGSGAIGLALRRRSDRRDIQKTLQRYEDEANSELLPLVRYRLPSNLTQEPYGQDVPTEQNQPMD